MIPPRFALAAVALAALVLSRRRPGLRPVALALGVLAAVNFARTLPPPPRVNVALFLVWPGVQAAFAWRAWAGRGWPIVALAFALYACFIALAPWSWAAHPEAYAVALRLPYWDGVAVSVVAWACRKDEGPGGRQAAEPSSAAVVDVPTGDRLASLNRAGALPSRARPVHGSASARPAQAIAYVLTISAALDVTIGALAPFAEWTRAAPLAWATWGACAVVLGWEWRRA